MVIEKRKSIIQNSQNSKKLLTTFQNKEILEETKKKLEKLDLKQELIDMKRRYFDFEKGRRKKSKRKNFDEILLRNALGYKKEPKKREIKRRAMSSLSSRMRKTDTFSFTHRSIKGSFSRKKLSKTATSNFFKKEKEPNIVEKMGLVSYRELMSKLRAYKIKKSKLKKLESMHVVSTRFELGKNPRAE